MNEAGSFEQPALPARAGATIAIDLKALQRNYRLMARTASPVRCGASLKANAYGIGLAQAAQALFAVGCRTFFVAFPDEGEAARTALVPEKETATVYVLGGLLAGEARFYETHRLQPVLSGPDELLEWTSYCRSRGRRLPGAIHIETGMNRLAFTEAQLREIVAGESPFQHLELSLVVSHLARGEEPEHEFNDRQRRRFDALRALLPEVPASLANSAGNFLGEAFRYDLVRSGIALYGGNPVPGRPNPCTPVVHFLARVLQLRDIATGESVGYGGSWVATRPSRIAVLGAGYGDGYPRSLASAPGQTPARVRIGEFFAPLVGRVSMDMITVDVTDLPEGAAGRGAVAELIGAHVTVDEIALKAGTNSFEVLTRLGRRCPRLYSSLESLRDKGT